MTRIQAYGIERLLYEKHHRDLCLSQCKTGASYGGGLGIIDFWAMKKSWAQFSVWAYEIKVNRNDFLRDEKWQSYLPYCTQFYFVCPPNVVQTEELPAEAGLLVTSKNGTRLYTKKKAPTRQIDLQAFADVCRYILMWRTKIAREQSRLKDADYWRQWVKERRQEKRLGHEVSFYMSQIIRKKVEEVETRCNRLQKENEQLQEFKQTLLGLGLTPYDLSGNSWQACNKLKDIIKEERSGLPNELVARFEATMRNFREIIEHLEGLLQKPGPNAEGQKGEEKCREHEDYWGRRMWHI